MQPGYRYPSRSAGGANDRSLHPMIPVRYNFRSIIVRRVGTIMTIAGVALTVAVFISILAMIQGLQSTYVDTGDPRNLVVIRKGSLSEVNSFFDREIKGLVETIDGVERIAGEIIVLINHPRLTGETTNIMVRGVSETSLELRPKLTLSEGRMFRTGLREVVVSRAISNRFKDARIGDTIKIGRAKWNVVGILDAAQTAFESEIWADYNEIAQEFERPFYSSLTVRARDDGAIQPIKDRIESDRRIKLEVFGEKEYFESQTSSASAPIQVLGYLVGIIMAIGSCFAVMNTMYASTAYRTREIATLRVLGYKRRNILASFVLESIVLAIGGGILGCLLALPVHGISTGTANFNNFAEVVFQFRITPALMAIGILFAATMGGIGGLLPALRASRVPIIRALRTEV
jgi:putative ABC transport system permease protein